MGWDINYVAIRYYDPGLIVNTNPTQYEKYCYDVSSIADESCKEAGLVEATGSYDAHYLVGNYYSFAAATAGSGNNAIKNGEIVQDSICPKGWKLPLSGSIYDSVNGSFYNLLVKYGLTNEITGVGIDGKDYNIAEAPLYFVRSGWVNGTSQRFRGGGGGGMQWSRVAISSNATYVLDFNNANHGVEVQPSISGIRYYGYPVRCLAQ